MSKSMIRSFQRVARACFCAAALALLLWGPVLPRANAQDQAPVPVTISTLPIERPAACSDRFVAHDLAHVTTTRDGIIRMFEGNGSGLAGGDLDNDGDLDLVLGNLHAPNSILWNEGNLTFRKTTFGEENTRALALVDVDADGRLDITLTRNTGVFNYWHNQGDGSFKRTVLPGVGKPAYSLAWADVDRDGDLDLATATYDAGLLTDLGNEYLLAPNGGVYLYENREGRFRPQQLAGEAQGLALLFHDANGDGRPDLLVGNDFDVRDMAFLNLPAGWTLSKPFAHTTHSTMSFDAGDIHNDGRVDLFASDMKPFDHTDPDVAMAWAPLMADMPMMMDPNEPQLMENVLLVQDDSDTWYNVSISAGVDAAGWAWAGRFGDLNNDGWLDLYVVNGFTEERLLGHLPNHELVEENRVFVNDGTGQFDEASAWGLNSTRSGRSMLMADFDADGDLDIVVNNVRSQAQLFENDLCGGDSVQVALRWPAMQNRNAIGAQVRLRTDQGLLTRQVRSGSGYLTGDPPLLHFGLAPGMIVQEVRILWPDGAISVLEEFPLNTLLTVTRE